MTTLWKQTNNKSASNTWQAFPPASDGDAPLDVEHTPFRIVPFRDGTRPSHVLISPAKVSVRVNGASVVGGLHVLQHKDELMVESQRMFFSAESIPVEEVYRHDGPTRRPRCPVCRAEVQDGQSVVRCPGCSRIYHQIESTADSPEKQCWTYSPTCRFCEHPTLMSGEPTWQPDDET